MVQCGDSTVVFGELLGVGRHLQRVDDTHRQLMENLCPNPVPILLQLDNKKNAAEQNAKLGGQTESAGQPIGIHGALQQNASR